MEGPGWQCSCRTRWPEFGVPLTSAPHTQELAPRGAPRSRAGLPPVPVPRFSPLMTLHYVGFSLCRQVRAFPSFPAPLS